MLKFKNILFVTSALFIAGSTFAQKGTQSPYSAFGLGERSVEGYALFSSLGGLSLANTDSAVVNTTNPASYSYIGRNMPIFQIGMNGKLSNFSTTNNSSNQRHFGLNQFQLGLPIGDKWGAGIGIQPYSFKGYAVTKYTIVDSDTTMQEVNEGSGGVRIANLGLAYRPLNMEKAGSVTIKMDTKDSTGTKKKEVPIKGTKFSNLSIGVNANYLFGTSEQIRSTEFVPSSASIFNARVIDGIRVSGLSTQAGLNYQVGFKSGELTRILSLGVTYSPASEVKAFQDIYSFSYIGSFYRGQSVGVLDTIEFVQDDEGSILKPETFGVGFEYRFSPFKSSSMLKIGADFKSEKWSTFYTKFSGVENPGGLRNRTSASLGFEWIPVANKSAFTQSTFFTRARYRVGFNYSQTELLVTDNLENQVGIDNYGMSFGLGIPILTGKSNTNINFGASLGNLGTTENGVIRERYMGIYVGLSLTPGATNQWFVKRKYN